jgi:prohibitin 1
MFFLVALAGTLLALALLAALRRRAGTGPAVPARAAAALVTLVALLLGAVALLQAVTVVPAGHVGVVDFFGTVSPMTLKAGINPVNPLARVVRFSVKTQELKELMDVPSKEGLTVQLELSALFHLNPEKAAEVYKTVGPDYMHIVLVPQFRSVARGVTASYDARALYTSEREQLAQTILKELQAIVEPRGIAVESTPLRKVGLPAGLTASIEQKLQAEQESQRMQFVLQKERQEAERKRIEAQGIADFQAIVTKGISDQLLRWKGIEATEKIAQSPNTKVVIVGAGKDGLPLLLDTK